MADLFTALGIVAFTAVMLDSFGRWTAYELLPDNPPRRRRHHVRYVGYAMFKPEKF